MANALKNVKAQWTPDVSAFGQFQVPAVISRVVLSLSLLSKSHVHSAPGWN